MDEPGPRLVLPVISDLNRPFWDGCANGELRLQACLACGRVRYPSADICPTCLSPDHEWRAMSGKGEILSWVVFRHGYQPAWVPRLPYNVVLVQLPEGPRMFGNVEPLETQDLAVGAPVRVVFVPASEPSSSPGSGTPSTIIPRWRLDPA